MTIHVTIKQANQLALIAVSGLGAPAVYHDAPVINDWPSAVYVNWSTDHVTATWQDVVDALNGAHGVTAAITEGSGSTPVGLVVDDTTHLTAAVPAEGCDFGFNLDG